jgi:hypothetical protein
MEDADELVIVPFREIVEKGRQAVENAGDQAPIMAKAAQALVKEGERGLKRIEPLCRKHAEDYGIAFVAALKDNDEIAKFRTELTELLWEFDDYIEPDTFDVGKFGELQTASRKAAPRIYDILMRMKLDVSFRDDLSSRGSIAQLPTPTSPPFLPASVASNSSGHYLSTTTSPVDFRTVDEATAQMRRMLQQASIDEGPPRPPSTNPWDWQVRQQGSGGRQGDDGESIIIAPPGDESPVLPPSALSVESRGMSSVQHPAPLNITSHQSEHGGSHDGGDERRLSSMSASSHNTFGHGYQRQKSVMSSFSIPEHSVSEHSVPQQNGMVSYFQPTGSFSPVSSHGRQTSLVPSVNSESSTTGELDTYRPPIESQQPAGFSPTPAPAVPHTMSAAAIEAQAGLQVVTNDRPAPLDSGPIPVETEQQTQSSPTPSSQIPHTTQKSVQATPAPIDTTTSFHLQKGFCDGAAEVIRGGIGVKRTKKPGFASSATVARCLSCLYELDFAEIEADVNKEERGNFTRNGINFRVRFLQKSHVTTKRVDDIQYACVFCIAQGHTIDRCDATVFFNQKALFDHLARHPRPLPNVPGLTVIDEPVVPAKYHNDYDIHFRMPTQRHPCVDRAAELSQMPSGVAKDNARRMYGQRLLYDRSPALELAAGARITGLTWPIQYQGEWCFGWHDGNWASVPTDIIKLDPPPASMIKYDRTSLIRGRARWKFSVKDKDSKDKIEWLKFEKGEVISNIAWVDSNYWCWSGTNSKGKTGIFPQACIDTGHLQEPQANAASRADSLSEEKARSSGGIMSKFSMRKTSTAAARPPSAAGSTSSRDTSFTAASRTRRFGDGSMTSTFA